ncbi:helix-turn-helix domain-containing protein [Sutterella sp.]|uniref:helix-turn-helix domain-containing protein n=1 Tax=Sutterella sp. TaxID=1981025 RepID=UPI0026DF0B57|nr:helix-turn-helix domain-containing protein [Sutterella sp.]MDO5532534.1 helix-turn-helix domain-containing protein [Sutterella sp.]
MPEKKSKQQQNEEFAPDSPRAFDRGLRALRHRRIAWRRFDGLDVRRIAADRRVTLADLASLIGVSRRSVYRWIADPSSMTLPMCVALAWFDVMGENVFHVMTEEARRMDAARGIEPEEPVEPPKPAGKGTKAGKDDGVPKVFSAEDVVRLRDRLDVSRKEFAAALDVSESTVAKWEQGDGVAKGPALILMRLLWKKVLKTYDLS